MITAAGVFLEWLLVVGNVCFSKAAFADAPCAKYGVPGHAAIGCATSLGWLVAAHNRSYRTDLRFGRTFHTIQNAVSRTRHSCLCISRRSTADDLFNFKTDLCTSGTRLCPFRENTGFFYGNTACLGGRMHGKREQLCGRIKQMGASARYTLYSPLRDGLSMQSVPQKFYPQISCCPTVSSGVNIQSIN